MGVDSRLSAGLLAVLGMAFVTTGTLMLTLPLQE
ncbi:MAG: hypothetical protein ACI8Y4_005123 [Candidatus Poriferisodalaceae bacterium]|jgi:hypothetical protein